MQAKPTVVSMGNGASSGGAMRAEEGTATAIAHGPGATMVYGAPVERDGITVIPVARILTSGSKTVATPAGYIELRDGKSRYQTPRSSARVLLPLAMLCLAAGIAASMMLGVLRHTEPGTHSRRRRTGLRRRGGAVQHCR